MIRGASTASTDPFEVLGLDETSDEAAVRSAYRRKAKAVHPDSPTGDPAAFVALRMAYDTLMDPRARERATAARRTGGAGDFASAFERVFDDLTENGRGTDRGPRRRRGVDVERRLAVGVEEAFSGGQHTLRDASSTCPLCGGAGSSRTDTMRTCMDCDGDGYVRRTKGLFTAREPCRGCLGERVVPQAPCAVCGGAGSVAGEGVRIALPPGVRQGARITVPGAGAPGANGGRSGDLHVIVDVVSGDDFAPEGDDVVVRVRVPVWDAALGAVLRVPALGGGTTEVTLPPGTQSGDELAIPSQGMRIDDRTRGRMRVLVTVEVPDGRRGPLRRVFEEMRALDAECRATA